MKQLFTTAALLLFICLCMQAQTPQTLYEVPTLTALQSYYGRANRLHVTENNTDYVVCSPCTVDGINVLSGADTRKWLRVTDPILQRVAAGFGVQPEAYGADADSTTRDDIPLQNCLNAAGKYAIIRLKPTVTYLLKANLELLEGQVLFMYGARLKSANQVTTTTTTPITTGSSPTTITVASTTGLEVGMQITVTSGPNGINGDYNPHTIMSINGNQITVSVPFTKAFPSGGTVVTHHGMIRAMGDNIKIYGGEIDGNRLNNLGYTAWQTNALIYISGAGVAVNNVHLHDGQADGVMVGGIGSAITYNRIERMGGNGIHLSGLTAGKITGNYVNYCTLAITGTDNNSGPSHAEGTMTWSNLVSHTLVNDNYFANARAMLGVIDGTDNNDNTITNNTGEDFSLYTVEFKDGTGVDNNSLKNFIFSNNRIYRGGLMYLANPSGAGWAYDAANRSFILSDNLFDHTGIEVVRGKDFRINDNVFDFKNDSVSTIINSVVSSNYSINNNTLLHGRTGIYVQPGNPGSGKDYIGSDGSLINNNLRDQYVYGIQIYGEQNYQHRALNVSMNTVLQTRSYLANYIGISGANGVKVERNTLDMASGKYGIECLGDATGAGYGVVGTTVRFNWINTPAETPSVRIGGGTAGNVVEFNTIFQAMSNGAAATNVVQNNVYENSRLGISTVILKTGTATFSGNSSTTAFVIPHELGVTPTYYTVTPTNAVSAAAYYVTADATNITITFLAAPATGTNNINYTWAAR